MNWHTLGEEEQSTHEDCNVLKAVEEHFGRFEVKSGPVESV